MDKDLHYSLSWNSGKGTNSLAEAKALAGLLTFCIYFDIPTIAIFEDSKIMIDHVNGKCHIKRPHLSAWMDKIMFLWGHLRECTIKHIYRAEN